MLRPQQVRQFCEHRYPSFLRSLVTGERFFPLDVPFGRLKATDDHRQLSQEIKALADGTLGYLIEWKIRRFRLTGEQRVPARVWFQSADDYLKAVGKSREVELFRQNLELTRSECPVLLDWITKHPLRVEAGGDVWPDLLKVCRYLQKNPRPGIYTREAPVQISTKFIEENKEILDLLLQQVFPALPSKRNGESFEDRYGFRSDEPCVRFKVLNKDLRISLGLIASDIAVPVSEARNFSWKGISVIIIENKMTFLSLPELPNTVSIWGGGGAAQLLVSLTWLQNCRVIYWGDIDTHGFHIVSRLRGGLPHLETVMMDHLTLEDCSSIVVPAREAKYEDTIMLTANEHAAYMRVRSGQLLLEQEKIPHSYAVARLVSATTIRS